MMRCKFPPRSSLLFLLTLTCGGVVGGRVLGGRVLGGQVVGSGIWYTVVRGSTSPLLLCIGHAIIVIPTSNYS